jgi:hypothetical protein
MQKWFHTVDYDADDACVAVQTFLPSTENGGYRICLGTLHEYRTATHFSTGIARLGNGGEKEPISGVCQACRELGGSANLH